MLLIPEAVEHSAPPDQPAIPIWTTQFVSPNSITLPRGSQCSAAREREFGGTGVSYSPRSTRCEAVIGSRMTDEDDPEKLREKGIEKVFGQRRERNAEEALLLHVMGVDTVRVCILVHIDEAPLGRRPRSEAPRSLSSRHLFFFFHLEAPFRAAVGQRTRRRRPKVIGCSLRSTDVKHV